MRRPGRGGAVQMSDLKQPMVESRPVDEETTFNVKIRKTLAWCIAWELVIVGAKLVVTVVGMARLAAPRAPAVVGVVLVGPTTQSGAQGGLLNCMNEATMAAALMHLRSSFKQVLDADEDAKAAHLGQED